MLTEFNKEIETINSQILLFNKEKKLIEYNNLLNLINYKKGEFDNGKEKNIFAENENKKNNKNLIKETLLTNEEEFNQLLNDINNKINNSNKKYISSINVFISILNLLNENIKEEKILSNGLNKISNNIYNKLLPKVNNDSEEIINEKKMDLNVEEMINSVNNLINKAIYKIQKIEAHKDAEINSLHERVEYFIKEMRIIKESNEALSRDQSKEYKIQKDKYEKQLKIKDETIKKLEKYISDENKIKQEGIKNVNDLTEELMSIKEKYEMQSKNYKNIGQRAREQNERSAMKDINTGKYVINEYLNKLQQFANGIYNHDDSEI
jgi:hypothetical protein